jgi:hypothetical protein
MPAWLAMNREVQMELEKAIPGKLKEAGLMGADMTEEALNGINEIVLNFLVEKYAVLKGLREYLDALKYVEG